MPRANARAIRFVRALLPQGVARRLGDHFEVAAPRGPLRLDAGIVGALVSDGVLAGGGSECHALPEAASWLRRQLADSDPHATQHRLEAGKPPGPVVDLAESPLARLAAASGGEAFLAPYQVEAGERFRRLFERAQLRPRTTMSYEATRTAGGKGTAAHDLTDMAADARRAVGRALQMLPRDCAGVVTDVCGLEKGLQAIEMERGWPRRSAKLVLRIGLDQLAQHFGLGSAASGRDRVAARSWMDEAGRPPMFSDS